MPQRTLLEAVNDVLLQVGERPSSSLQTAVGRKAVLAIEAALTDINVASDWVFKKLATPITAQNQEIFTIPGLERLDRVLYRPTTGRERRLALMPYDELRMLYKTQPGEPRAFATIGNEQIAVLPYPEELGVIWAYGTTSIRMPVGPSEVIDLPERFYPLLLSRALYHMLLTHLADSQAAAGKNQEFLTLVARFIQKESSTGRQDRNMYRRRGRNDLW